MSDDTIDTTLPMAEDAIATAGKDNPFAKFDGLQGSSTPKCPAASQRVTRSRSKSPQKKFRLVDQEKGLADSSEKRRKMLSGDELEDGQIVEDLDEDTGEGHSEQVDLKAILKMQEEILGSLSRATVERDQLKGRLEKSERLHSETIERMTTLKGMLLEKTDQRGFEHSLSMREMQNSQIGTANRQDSPKGYSSDAGGGSPWFSKFEIANVMSATMSKRSILM